MLAVLEGERNLSSTIIELASARMLRPLLNRVVEVGSRRELCQMLGSRLNAEARSLAEACIATLGLQWELQFNLGRLGVSSAAVPFNADAYSFLIARSASAPFTGSGATGVSETTLSVPFLDKLLLALGHRPTRAWYSNPISNSPGFQSLPGYLVTLTPLHRALQARLLFGIPINSVVAASYAGSIPSRAQVVQAAAAAHNLSPDMLGAFILAEQRDQSRNEDAAEYVAAASPLRADTSIGLGQVRISTVRNHDAFADLLTAKTRRRLSHRRIATLLVSEEFNIFAAARFIRQLADAASKLDKSSLPNSLATLASLKMPDFAKNSAAWPADNVRAIAARYTSNSWAVPPFGGWSDFVLEAYRDVVASGWFSSSEVGGPRYGSSPLP